MRAAQVCHRDIAGVDLIINKDTDNWYEVKIEVNREYVHETAVIAAGDTMRFFPNIFTKNDGTRLNLATTACKTIDIHATMRGKRDHYNGGYR